MKNCEFYGAAKQRERDAGTLGVTISNTDVLMWMQIWIENTMQEYIGILETAVLEGEKEWSAQPWEHFRNMLQGKM